LEEEQQAKRKKIGKRNASPVEEQLYVSAAKEIVAMLIGKEKVNIKKTVWLAENPYLRGQESYEQFSAQLKSLISFCKTYAQEQHLDWKKHDHRVKALVHLFSKTIMLKNGTIHQPFKYDFEDPYGKHSYKPLMVSKLLKTQTGQCHSMPLLFKILAEEINIKAYVALSPAHSYVKLFLKEGRQAVFETTNGYLTSENWLLSTNVVPFTAMRSGVYLDTLSEKETLVHCLTHLANAYESEFGYKRLVYDIAEIGVTFAPKYPPAWALFSNYVTYTTMEALAELNYPTLEEIDQYPALKKRLQLTYQIYADMDKMGYKDLKEATYREWLENNQEAIKKHQLQDF